MDLHDLLKRPECKTLAFKRDLSSPDGALKTIVTFANTAGGTLQSGVEDRSRNVRGVSDGWILAGRFAGSDKSRILDRIEIHSFPVQAVEEASAFVQKHSWHGTSIGAVRRTDRWSLPPPIFEEIATRLRVTIPTVPVGPTVVIATEQAIIISLNKARPTRTRLYRLIDRGLVREIGTSINNPQRKYFLAEGGPL
jgi:hypothetical protein